jgi:hypothetical protein
MDSRFRTVISAFAPSFPLSHRHSYPTVIPAKAGIHLESSHQSPTGWIPAFAGMTVGGFT